MGDMAEALLEGVFCQSCGEYMGSDDPDWQPPGHPVTCAACSTPTLKGVRDEQ